MKLYDRLIESFAYNDFNIKGVYKYKVDSDNKGFEKTSPFPGFIFPISGKAQYKFDGTPYVAKMGNIIHGGANMDLDKEVVSKKSWEFVVVLYDMYLKSGDLELDKLHFELNIGRNPKILNNLLRLSNIQDDEPMSMFRRENIFRSMLEDIFTSAHTDNLTDTEKLFSDVSSFIQENYDDNISIKGLSELNGVTENQLSYAFNKHTKMGPGEYLIRFRMNMAKNLLVETELSIGEISELVGYVDPLYFSRIYKKTYGLSPNNFRKEFKNNPYKFKDKAILL